MLLLIKSLETAEPSGKSKVRMFRRNFTFNLHYRVLCRSLEMRGKGETHDRWAGLPDARPALCLKRKPSRPASGRPGTPAPSHPRATAPIEEAERQLRQPIHAETTGSVHDTYRLIDSVALLSAIPARHAAGPGGGAALAQLMAESHPDHKRRNST